MTPKIVVFICIHIDLLNYSETFYEDICMFCSSKYGHENQYL